MKNLFMLALLLCAAVLTVSCGDEVQAADTPEDAPAITVEESRTVILADARRAQFELDDPAFDCDAFIDWLPGYFAGLYEDGGELVVFVEDIIAPQTEGDYGTVTLLAGYHEASAAITGRNENNRVGGCNFFFTYSRKTGADFAEELFAGGERLGGRVPAKGNDFSDYVPTVDENGRVQLYKDGAPVITTPGVYCRSTDGMIESMRLWHEGDSFVLLLNQHEMGADGAVKDSAMVYVSHDGGASWSAKSLSFTPITTTTIYPVTDLVLNMRDADNGTAILGTNRTEVFFYVTEDGGKSWEKRRSFQLLRYQNQGLHDGGMVTDTLGFITFIPRDGKNPNVYITHDGGRNWELMDITLPEGYSDADAYGERAYIEGDVIILPIICGGETLHYVSADEGKTWTWQ